MPLKRKNMGDRYMNDFTPVQDAAYMYAEDANGNQVKIKKSDLIALLKNNLSYLDISSWSENLNDIEKNGVYFLFSGTTNNPPNGIVQGSILIHISWNYEAMKQMYFMYGSDAIYVRSRRGDIWSSWKSISMT